jgi:hypothetical protein
MTKPDDNVVHWDGTPEPGSDLALALKKQEAEEERPRLRFHELRGLFTNAIAWTFWGDEERQIVNVPSKRVNEAREAAERCIEALEHHNKAKMEDSALCRHARRELELCHEDEEMIQWYLEVILAFISYGHSGGSASVTIPILNDLLQFKNLTPLTKDPDEWVEVGEIGDGEPLWQNVRNSKALSLDGGNTHYFVDDPPSLRLVYDTQG